MAELTLKDMDSARPACTCMKVITHTCTETEMVSHRLANGRMNFSCTCKYFIRSSGGLYRIPPPQYKGGNSLIVHKLKQIHYLEEYWQLFPPVPTHHYQLFSQTQMESLGQSCQSFELQQRRKNMYNYYNKHIILSMPLTRPHLSLSNMCTYVSHIHTHPYP